ncbi:MAG: ATP-dependent acyl-CoA ligase [Betaproteobacteria bacterium]|nr:ATP-dependent acyl-CoA ligase [Betaproteobacteria bacterium]
MPNSSDLYLHPFTGFDLNSLLELRARSRAGHPFIVWSHFDGPARTWTYAQFADEVARIAGGLASRGVKNGDRVMVFLENCPETLLTMCACARLGAIHMPINAMAAGPELAWYAQFSGALGAITQPRLAATLASHCPGLQWIAVTETDAGTPAVSGDKPDRSSSFASLYGAPLAARAPDPELPLLIMYTSGTTSRPKGVVWTHANALWAGRLGAMHQALRPDDVYQIFLPLFHVVALSWSFLPALWAGNTVVLQPRFSASRYWPAALAHGATVGSQVILSVRLLTDQPVPKDHRIRQWLNATHLAEYEQKLGIRMMGAWGMTEMVSQGIVSDPWMPQRNGAIGKPSPGYRIRILDDDGRATVPGGTGNLLAGGVRGLSIFMEYFANREATAEAFDEDGYFRTGDRVILHEDGFIEFSERAKDLIKVGGEGVAPAEVERVISELKGIRDVAVVAKPDSHYGEVVAAFVVVDEAAFSDEQRGNDAVSATIISHCAASLAKFKVPREIIVLPEMPRVSIGKISKAKLRERFAPAK